MDGGGSSVMIVNGEVKNSPSDGAVRPVGNGMLVVSNALLIGKLLHWLCTGILCITDVAFEACCYATINMAISWIRICEVFRFPVVRRSVTLPTKEIFVGSEVGCRNRTLTEYNGVKTSVPVSWSNLFINCGWILFAESSVRVSHRIVSSGGR